MNNQPYFPLSDPYELPGVVYFDLRLSGLACLGMMGARMLALRRYRRMKTADLPVPAPWSLAFHWPVFVWAIQAIGSFYSGFQVTGPRSLNGLLGTWEYAYGGVIALICVISICITSGWFTVPQVRTLPLNLPCLCRRAQRFSVSTFPSPSSSWSLSQRGGIESV